MGKMICDRIFQIFGVAMEQEKERENMQAKYRGNF